MSNIEKGDSSNNSQRSRIDSTAMTTGYGQTQSNQTTSQNVILLCKF